MLLTDLSFNPESPDELIQSESFSCCSTDATESVDLDVPDVSRCSTGSVFPTSVSELHNLLLNKGMMRIKRSACGCF